jgi:hypothetical protein
MVQNASVPVAVQFEACPACGFAMDAFGFLGFEKWGPQVLAWAARSNARNEIQSKGIYPDDSREPDRDPFYSLLRDLTQTFMNDLFALPEEDQRYLVYKFVKHKPIEHKERLFHCTQELVESYKAIKPKIFA